MRTPRSKPERLMSANSAAVPWNQVAIIRPSGCHNVKNRSQSPESRQITQSSISLRICSRSSPYVMTTDRTPYSATRGPRCRTGHRRQPGHR